MDMLSAGGFILAFIAFVYAIQLGLQMRKLRQKIEEIEARKSEVSSKK